MSVSSGLLRLDEYRTAIALDERFRPAADPATAEDLVGRARTALQLLLEESVPATRNLLARDVEQLGDVTVRSYVRALLTVRDPRALSPDVVRVLDELLGGERETRATGQVADLLTIQQSIPGTSYPAANTTCLWQGDITTLAADAIVNAANSGLLGCFVPMHQCIDNAIHSAAGPALREDCATIIGLQGHKEPTATAKVTRGYHLPARYVLHTVGPVIAEAVREDDPHLLASAYRAVLDLALEVGSIRSVALCAISTGIFGYPKPEAAKVALRSVGAWLEEHDNPFQRVIFTAYTTDDYAAYRRALTEEY